MQQLDIFTLLINTKLSIN